MFKLTSVRADKPTSAASCLNIHFSSICRFFNYRVTTLLVSCRRLSFLHLAHFVLSDSMNRILLTVSEKYFDMAHLNLAKKNKTKQNEKTKQYICVTIKMIYNYFISRCNFYL